MNKDEIIAMAREAGFILADNATDEAVQCYARFAAMAVAAEREACAKVCDERARQPMLSNHRRCDADMLARSIRARGDT